MPRTKNDNQTGNVRLTAEIPAELHRQIKTLAAIDGQKLKDVVEHALTIYVRARRTRLELDIADLGGDGPDSGGDR